MIPAIEQGLAYTLTDRATGKTRPVSRDDAAAWIAKNWCDPMAVLAEVEANAKAATTRESGLRSGWTALTVRLP